MHIVDACPTSRTLLRDPVYRTIAIRTVRDGRRGDGDGHRPGASRLAYYAARLATAADATVLLFAVVMPLWTNYLVRVFAGKLITAGNGPAELASWSAWAVT